MNGFIVTLFAHFMSFCFRLNVVEWIKSSARFVPTKLEQIDANKNAIIARENIAIDLYMIAKWAFIILALFFSWDSRLVFWITCYLIASNLFGYFYHHVWGGKYPKRVDKEAKQRRFVNFLLAVGFYIACYAVLYANFYASQISWPDCTANVSDAIYLSVANAFTLTYGDFKPLTHSVRMVFMTELINTFFFFTIIVANSVPDDS